MFLLFAAVLKWKFSYLQGPHIASVTMAAYECNSLDFPEPPYPERFYHFIIFIVSEEE